MSKRWIALVALAVTLGVSAVALQACISVRKSDRLVAGPAGAVSSEEADIIVSRARELHTAALLVVKDGRELMAWGDVDEPVDVRSMRKSVNNLILGGLSLKGRVDLTATLDSVGINGTPDPLTVAEKQATVLQLMESRSGVYHPAARETRSASELRPRRGEHAPGTFWYYNNWDFNALERVAAHLSGDADWCATFVREAAPVMGIQDADKRCEVENDENSAIPAHRLRLTARELVKLAQLYLDDGVAGGRRLLPSGWSSWSVEPVSNFHYLENSKFDYGRLFWSIDPYGPFEKQTFMMRGAGSQYVWVIPEANLVIVHLVRTEPLLLRQRLGLIPDDNDVWTFGGMIGSAVLEANMKKPRTIY